MPLLAIAAGASVPLRIRYDYAPPLSGGYHLQSIRIGYENNPNADLLMLGACLKTGKDIKPRLLPQFTLFEAENHIKSKPRSNGSEMTVCPEPNTHYFSCFHYLDVALIDNKPGYSSDRDIDWMRVLLGRSFSWYDTYLSYLVHATTYFGVSYKSMRPDGYSFAELSDFSGKDYSGFALSAGLKGAYVPHHTVSIHPQIFATYHFAGVRVLEAGALAECRILLSGNELYQRHSLVVRGGWRRVQFSSGSSATSVDYLSISVGLLFRLF